MSAPFRLLKTFTLSGDYQYSTITTKTQPAEIRCPRHRKSAFYPTLSNSTEAVVTFYPGKLSIQAFFLRTV